MARVDDAELNERALANISRTHPPKVPAHETLRGEDPRILRHLGVVPREDGGPVAAGGEPLASMPPPPEPVASSVNTPPPGVVAGPPAAPEPPPMVDMSALPVQRMLYAVAKARQTPTTVGGIVGASPPAPNTPPTSTTSGGLTPSDFAQGAGVAPKAAAAASPPSGPTAEDDRELAAFEKNIGKQPSASGGGGGGAPNDFGLKSARERYRGTFDTEEEAIKAGSAAEQVREVNRADAAATLARQQQEDAALDRVAAEAAQKHYDEQTAKLQDQLDAIKQKKIDPLRGMHGGGLQVLSIISGAMAGLYQGVNHLASNPFIDDMNRTIDRNIAMQEKELDGARANVADRLSLLGQQRANFRDNQTAKLATRSAYYAAAKQEIEAQATRDNVPAMKANADLAVNAVDRAKAANDVQLAQALQAQANAAGARQRELAKEMSANYAALWDKALAAGLTPDQAESEATRQLSRMYGGNPGARPPNDASALTGLSKEERQKQHEARNEVSGALHTLDTDFGAPGDEKKKIPSGPQKIAAGSVINAHWPDALNSSQGKAENEERERWNAFVRQAVGAAWRLQTNGVEPKNPEILDDQAKPFLSVPTDQAEDVKRKQNNLRKHLTNAGNSQGIRVPNGAPSVQTYDASGRRE